MRWGGNGAGLQNDIIHGFIGVILQNGRAAFWSILNTIHCGDAFLSRLEGEWWTRFCDLRDVA